jgi:hypothetical protein
MWNLVLKYTNSFIDLQEKTSLIVSSFVRCYFIENEYHIQENLILDFVRPAVLEKTG